MKITEVKYPLGYRVETIAEQMDVYEAEKLLTGRKRRKYTSALRNAFGVQMIRHVWVCPYCGWHSPAYPAYFDRLQREPPVKKTTVRSWAGKQLSLYEDEGERLLVNHTVPETKLTCPSCRKMSAKAQREKSVTVCQDGHTLKISAAIVEMREIRALGWVRDGLQLVSLPLCETAVFNFRRGTVHLRLEDATGTALVIRDVTDRLQDWGGDPLYKTITSNRLVRREVKRSFREVWGGALPFPENELTAEKYAMMTRFIGYPRRFYDQIPFLNDTSEIDRSFRRVEQRLHLAGNLEKIYSRSSLPRAKTVRRLFFENPGLFFYLKECEFLWQLLGDVNLFRSLLSCNSAFFILSQIHLYPCSGEFYRDYLKVKGKIALEDRLRSDAFRAYAISYVALNTAQRKREREKWRGRRAACFDRGDSGGFDLSHSPVAEYSVPMHETDDGIRSCTIDGFFFRWLKNKKDYTDVGNQLHNCLTEWSRYQMPVIGVFSSGKAVAAIEVDVKLHSIEQMHTAWNGDVDQDQFLRTAVEKWMKRYGLRFDDSEEFDLVF